jgi:hypothetical protein
MRNIKSVTYLQEMFLFVYKIKTFLNYLPEYWTSVNVNIILQRIGICQLFGTCTELVM